MVSRECWAGVLFAGCGNRVLSVVDWVRSSSERWLRFWWSYNDKGVVVVADPWLAADY